MSHDLSGVAGSLSPPMASFQGPERYKQSAAVFIDEVVNTCVSRKLLSTQCVSVGRVKDERRMTSGCQQEVQLVGEG